MTPLESTSLPGVKYTRDPSEDPEENVDAEIFLEHL